MLTQMAAFAIFGAVLAVTPGLDTMLVVRMAAVAGRAAGLAAIGGIAAGCLLWAVASALGVTAVLSASRLAFEVLRFAGVAYLCSLGGRALWHNRRPHKGNASPMAEPQAGEVWAGKLHAGRVRVGRVAAFRTGLVTNALNPKVGVFYLSVMPQFLPNGVGPLLGALALGAIHVAEGVVWLMVVVLAVGRARGWLTRPAVKRRLEQVTGLVFLAFGLRLALERAPRSA